MLAKRGQESREEPVSDAREDTSISLSASPCQWLLVVMFLCVSDGSPVPCPPIHRHSFPTDWDSVSHQFLSYLCPCVGSKHMSGGNYHLTSSLKPLRRIYPLLPVLDMPFPCLWQSGDVLMHPTCCSRGLPFSPALPHVPFLLLPVDKGSVSLSIFGSFPSIKFLINELIINF